MHLEACGGGLPHVAPCFSSCLGVLRQAANDPNFITSAFDNIVTCHDRLLDLVDDFAEENSFVALRLLHVCGVQRFGHIINDVPPPLVLDFATARDEAVTASYAVIQQKTPSPESTHSLPVGATGATLTSLARHAPGSCLEAFYRVACPLQ